MPNWFERRKFSKTDVDNDERGEDEGKKTKTGPRLSFRQKIKRDIVNTADKPEKIPASSLSQLGSLEKISTSAPTQANPKSLFETVQLKRTQVNKNKTIPENKSTSRFIKPQLKSIRKDETHPVPCAVSKVEPKKIVGLKHVPKSGSELIRSKADGPSSSNKRQSVSAKAPYNAFDDAKTKYDFFVDNLKMEESLQNTKDEAKQENKILLKEKNNMDVSFTSVPTNKPGANNSQFEDNNSASSTVNDNTNVNKIFVFDICMNDNESMNITTEKIMEGANSRRNMYKKTNKSKPEAEEEKKGPEKHEYDEEKAKMGDPQYDNNLLGSINTGNLETTNQEQLDIKNKDERKYEVAIPIIGFQESAVVPVIPFDKKQLNLTSTDLTKDKSKEREEKPLDRNDSFIPITNRDIATPVTHFPIEDTASTLANDVLPNLNEKNSYGPKSIEVVPVDNTERGSTQPRSSSLGIKIQLVCESKDAVKPHNTSNVVAEHETHTCLKPEKSSDINKDLQDQNDKILDTDKPPVALNGTLQKEEETKGTNEKENKQIDKLEKLIKAKENSIKTFISKNDSLTQELLATKEHLREKDNVLRSVNESLQAVVDRCSYKTKQFEDMEEKCERLTDQNRIIENEQDQLKRKFVDLESECQDYMRLNDDNKDVIGNQKQLLRRREEEILELRRECQERQDREKSSVESIKKRADRSFTEAEEVQVQLKKLREKMEKEKRDLFEEIQNSERAKADISAKLLTTENHLKKSKDENMNAANNLSFTKSELQDLQLKFNGTMKEKNIMKDGMANLELKMNTTLSENKLMRKELDNVKIEKDTLSQQKASLNNRISALQKELENEKEKCSKKEISIEEYKRQCQQYQQDINMANSRSDDIVKLTMEEEEVARRKWQNRLQDAEDEITRLTARLKVSEKSKADQGAELEQVSFDLNQLTKNFGALEKKRQQDEQIINEQLMLEQESNEKIDTMKRRMTDYSGQLASLKQEYEEEIAQNRGLRLKLKSVQDELSDEQHEKENNERKQLDTSRTIARLQEQIEAQNVAISELEGDLEGSSARADKAHKEMLFSMEQQTNTVSEKDEEIELVKKTCRGTINLLKQQLDDAEQEIHRLNMIKGDLEQEIVLTQGDLDEAEATVNELNNEIPRQQDILEQLNMSLSDMSGRCEALQDALVRADNKCTQLQGRNEQLETDLNKEESSKRQLVQDNIDLNNKIAEHGARMESLQDTMIKLEEQLLGQSQVLETLEDEKSEWVLEKRKMREIITALEADNHHLDESRDTLEQSEKKLKSRIQGLLSDHEDALGTLRQTHRNRLRVLESRVAELEHALEDETEERTNHEKTVKKLERMLNDMELQSREDTKSIERQVEQISNLSTRNKNLKVACANSESRITTLQSRLRKLTAEMEESENRAATMSKMLSSPAGSRCGTPASLRQSRMRSESRVSCCRPDSRMSWDEFADPKGAVPYNAMIRSSLVGSRSVSRLISPEVEHIIMSGRNSPVGPLAPISPGYMSPRSISVQDGPDCGSNFDFEEKINGSHYVESDAKDSEIEQSNGEGIGLEQDTGTSEKVSYLENAQSTIPPQVLITNSGNDKIKNNADPKEDKSDM